MNKSNVLRLVRVICFLLILAMLLLTASYMLAPKDNTADGGIVNPNANGFFSEPKNSIDVAVIGNSDAYSGFSPMELWNEYGYTSYVSAEGRQSVAKSCKQLKSILSCQQPKVVILETDGFFGKSKVSNAVVNMLNNSLGSYFSIFEYHNRWKNAKPSEYFKTPEYTAHCSTRGQKLSNDVKGYMGGEYMVKTELERKIPKMNVIAINSFIKTCRDNDIEVVFLELPSQVSWSYEKHNAVQRIADRNSISFIDLNIDRKKFNFDWKKDTRDGGNHLNNRGARKATVYVGKFLKEKYSLNDYRKDKKYSQWGKDYKEYKSLVKI